MRKQEQFNTVQPKSEILKKYIAYFYFHKSGSENDQKQYVYYPNHKAALTIYQNSISDFNNFTSTTEPVAFDFYQHLYLGIKPNSILVKIIPPFDKIGIVFQPLGINYFLSDTLKNIFKNQVKAEFDYFKKEMETTCNQIFSLNNIDEKRDLLDVFFLEQFKGFQEDRIIQAVDLIINSTENLTVNELSVKLNLNRKTLLRLFQEHLNCTVKEYLDIVRFRKALNMYQTIEKKPLLTALALENGYYDQSEFIRHFKKVTGYNPKKLFKNIKHLGNEDTFWTLLDKN